MGTHRPCLHESPASLAMLISITGSRYQRYSDDLTDSEKNEIVDCIIKTSERHIALTGSHASLGKLGAFVHPKMDAYVEKMRGVPGEDAKYSVNSLEDSTGCGTGAVGLGQGGCGEKGCGLPGICDSALTARCEP